MVLDTSSPIAREATLPKCPTGIQGLDEITCGGLPKGRPTLVCGGPGCGKTLFGMEFLVRGATEYDEPGIFVTFEEKAHELAENVLSLGWDLKELEARGKLIIEHILVERSEIEETGEYDLEGLFIRLGSASGCHRGQADRAGYGGVAFRGTSQRADPTLGASAALPLVQAERPHGGHHRGAGRHDPHPAWA